MVGRRERWRQTGSYTEKEGGIERWGRNKENERDSINKRPLPYCLWLQHYPLEQPTNPHRWLSETIKCSLSAMITNLMAKIISTEIICENICLLVFLLGHKSSPFHQTVLSVQFLSQELTRYDIKDYFLFFFSFLLKPVFSPHPKHHTTVMATPYLNNLSFQFFSAEYAHGVNIIFARLTL